MKKTKELGEKNAMAVTLVPASRHFETQSFFLKQPVAEALINGDPLTLPVPVNGAKSDRLLEPIIDPLRLPGAAARDTRRVLGLT